MNVLDLAFIKNFEAEVHVQYMTMGSKLRNTVRNKVGIAEASTNFTKVGGDPGMTVALTAARW